MTLTATIKKGSYFRRYQVSFRRAETTTDYYARKRMIWQDKNKYYTRKYRLIVRFTNKDIISQIVYARLDGDKVFCSAYSHELPRYGMMCGLNNYSAAYATGLLLARRVLTKLNMQDIYQGNIEADGGRAEEEVDDERKPFTASLDLGLKQTTKGANLFGVLKGAIDGGIDVAYSENKFPGFDKKSDNYNSDQHKDRIMGKHVEDYMRMLEDNEELYNKTFSQYIANGINADNLGDMIKSTHDEIRADPSASPSKKENYKGKKYSNRSKMNLKQRKNRINQIKISFLSTLTINED